MFSLQGRHEIRFQAGQPFVDIGAKIYPSHTPSVFLQCFQISQSLGLLERAKGIGSAGDRDIFVIIRSQLQEQPRVRAALMELTCGMQEARSITQGGWYM